MAISTLREQSSYANQTSISETMDLVKYLIISHPGITNKEIQQLLEQEGRKIGNHSIRNLTILLEGDNSVRTNKEGRVKRFFPKDTSDQPK